MMEEKYWVINLDETKKTSVKLANNTYVEEEGVGDIVIKMRDGRSALIEKVLFSPGIRCNLLSIGIGDIMIKRKDGMGALVQKVLYILGINCNMLSI